MPQTGFIPYVARNSSVDFKSLLTRIYTTVSSLTMARTPYTGSIDRLARTYHADSMFHVARIFITVFN